MKRILSAVLVLTVVAVAVFFSPVCSAADKEPIKIGALFAVTGPASFLGAPEEKTVRMMEESINAAGGVLGSKIQVIVKDTGGSPEKAVSFAKQLIEEEGVLAIIGPSTSGETMQIKGLCEESQMLLVSCAAAEVIVNPVAKFVFKTPQKDSQAVTWIFNTMKEMGISKIAVLSSVDGFGDAGKKQVLEMAPAAGIEVVAQEGYDSKATDLTDVLTKVKATPGVQAVVNWTITPAQSIICKNMKQMKFDVPLFQSHGFGNPKYVEQAGVAAEGVLFPAGRLLVVDELAADHPQKQLLAAYKKDYETKYKEPVSTFGGHAYDALLVVVEGIFNFSATDHTGLDLTAFEMLTVKDGKFTIYKK
jgi:branched-chain amino acid transport system substrate-binding protein